MELTSEYKLQLVDALLECPMVSDRDIRNSIVNHLPDSIKNTIQRHSADRVDVVNIVTRCSNFNDGIEKLINEVRLYEGNSEPMKKVELFRILSETDISPDDLKKYYNDCLPEKFKSSQKAVSLFPIIKHLSDILLQPDKTLPLLNFVQKIAEKSNNQQVAEKLKEWINKTVSDFGKPIEIKKQADQPAQSLPIHLLVRLIPNPDNRNQKGQELFTVEIHSWKSLNDVECKNRIENCLLTDVRKKLDEFILSEFDEDDAIQTIEFILPCELIGLDVDQWVMEEGRILETTFGKVYRVLTRLDRHWLHRTRKKVHPSLRQEWMKRWKLFNDHAQTHESSVSWFCNHRYYEPKKLCNCFAHSEIASCLVMTFMPSVLNDGIGLGHAILQAGIPVALCYRKYVNHIENPEIIEHEIKSIISDKKKLLRLPDLIFEKRRQEQDIGNHLTLIWDNPERVLPKTYLQTP